MKVTVLPNQTLMDIAIQYCGALSAWPEIVALNGLTGLTANLSAGQVLVVPAPHHQRTAQIYSRNGYKPATSPMELLEGIDYWFIYEYIVQ